MEASGGFGSETAAAPGTTETSKTPETASGGGGLEPHDSTEEGGRLSTDKGDTTIATGVVAKVVGIAAREVPGVWDMGAAAGRAIGKATQRVGIGDERTQGVSVEVGTREAAADLVIVVEYGESIPQVAGEVRDNVIRRVEGICGLDVTEVNIAVNDMHFVGDEDTQASRVE
ncbi:MAG: Asp23/Gls24 family envelope stress response protein [Thermoleophilaceae bacterium]